MALSQRCAAGKAPSFCSVAVRDGLHGEEADVHFGLDVDPLPHLQGRGERGRVLAGGGERSETPTFRKSSKVMPSYTSSGPCAQRDTNRHSCTHGPIRPCCATPTWGSAASHRAGHARAGSLQHGPLCDGTQRLLLQVGVPRHQLIQHLQGSGGLRWVARRQGGPHCPHTLHFCTPAA